MSSLVAGGGGGLAGLARVAFESTGVGETTRGIDTVKTAYRSSAEDMSDSAIKVQLAQERLERALRKGPSAYREQANAELALRRSERELRQETDHLTRSLDRNQRELGQSARGVIAGSGALRGLGRSVAFASASFLGGAGLIYGMRQAIEVASNLDEQTNKARVTFGQSADEVVDWGKTTSTSIGIANDRALEYASTLGGILHVSGLTRSESAKLSTEFVELAADMASFNNASPEDTLEAIRAGLVGESEPLRRYQVLLSEARVKQEAYSSGIAKTGSELTDQQKVLARYRLILKDTADQQGDYARTSDGLANSQRTLSALWRDAQGILGQALAPAFTEVVQGARDWLAEDKNREELQRNINTLVKDGVTVSRAFAHALGDIKDAVSPLVDVLGGLDRTIELVLVGGLLYKARNALRLGVIPLRFGIAAWGPTATASAATTVAAENAIGTGALAQIPKVASLRAALAGLSLGSAAALGGVLAAGAAGGLVVVKGLAEAEKGLGLTPSQSEQAKRVALAMSRVDVETQRKYWANLSPTLRRAVSLELQKMGRVDVLVNVGAADQGGIGGYDEGGIAGRRPGARTPPARRGGGTTSGRQARTMADILLDQARAATTPDDADDLRFHREARDLIQRQINRLEAVKNKTAKQKEQLTQLYNDLEREQSAIDAIIEGRESAAQKKREEAAARAEKRQERADAWAKRTLDRLDRKRKAQRDATDAYVKRLLHEKSPTSKTDSSSGKGLTAADVRRMQFDFLTTLTGEIGQWGSNFQPDGGGSSAPQVETNSHLMVSLLRDQNAHIERLVAGAWHPGAQLASAELAAADWGVGF